MNCLIEANFLRELAGLNEAADAPLFAGRVNHHQHTLLAGDVFRPGQCQVVLQLVEDVLGDGHVGNLKLTGVLRRAAAKR